MKIRELNLEQAEYVAHSLAQKLMDYDEPLPEFATRYPGKLESCLKEPFQTFEGKALHRTFVERAAILFYLVTKDHPFSNGNKRMAVTLTLVFCFVNKRWLHVPPEDLYKIACDVAESPPKDREVMQRALKKFFKRHVRLLARPSGS